MQFLDQLEPLEIQDNRLQGYKSRFTYIRTPVLHRESEFHCQPDKWRQIYRNELRRTGGYVFHRLLVDLKRSYPKINRKN